jgi:hypothetical protein
MAINPSTNRIYIADGIGGIVTVLDGADNSVLDTIQLAAPFRIAVNPVTNLIYVFDVSNTQITILDGATNEIITIPLDMYPTAVSVDSNTNLIYVAGDGIILVLNGTEISTVTPLAEFFPRAIAVSPNTNLVYASNSDASTIVVIDGNTNTVVGIIPVEFGPGAIAINPNTNLVYAAATGTAAHQGPSPMPEGGTLSIISSMLQRARSEADGSFSFTGLAAGNYTLTEIPDEQFGVTQPATGAYRFFVSDKHQVLSGFDFGIAPASGLGKLTILSQYSGYYIDKPSVPMTVSSEDGQRFAGFTPVTFTLKIGQNYTVFANNTAADIFEQWENSDPEEARSFTMSSDESLVFIASYTYVPNGNPVRVDITSSELVNGTEDERPLPGMFHIIQEGDDITKILIPGATPAHHQLVEGSTYVVFAGDGGFNVNNNFIFDYWVDPYTGEPVFKRGLKFTAQDGLAINAVYHFSNSTSVTIPVSSRLVDGTPLDGAFNKVILGSDDTNIVDRGFTPNEYHLQRDAYTAVAADFKDNAIVFDHWEASGGPFLSNRELYANEFPFDSFSLGLGLENLTAVYRIVPENDFASIPLTTTGTNITSSEPQLNNGVTITFDNVLSTGDLTLARIPVDSHSNIFSNVSLTGETATLGIENRTKGNTTIYTTSGPVIQVNTARLTLVGMVEVTLHYDPSSIPAGLSPRMLHFNGTEWEDVTVSYDGVSHTVTGRLNSLSPIVVGYTESKFGIGGVKGQITSLEHRGDHGTNFGAITNSVDSGSHALVKIDIPRNVGTAVSEAGPILQHLTVDIDNVVSAGQVSLSVMPISDFEEIIDIGKGNPPKGLVVSDGSTFYTLDNLVYDLSSSSDLNIQGNVILNVSLGSINGPQGQYFYSNDFGSIRLLQHTDNHWTDITESLDPSSRTIIGSTYSLSPIIITFVTDGTFAERYFESHPLQKIDVKTIAVESLTFAGSSDESDMISIHAELKNVQRADQTYDFIVQITDEKGTVTYLDWLTAIIQRNQTIYPSIDWTPERSGSYDVNVFVWSDLNKVPMALTEVTATKLSINLSP